MKTLNLKSLIARKNWLYVNSDITDENFPAPKVIRTKNWKLIKMDKSFSSKEALERIKKEGCTPANIYELAQFAAENPEQFPERQWTSVLAFGSEWTDSDGDHRVPRVSRSSDGDWEFYLGYFEDDWSAGTCLLCFCDKPLHPQTLGEAKSSGSLTLTNAIELIKKEGYKIFKEI